MKVPLLVKQLVVRGKDMDTFKAVGGAASELKNHKMKKLNLRNTESSKFKA